MVYSLSIDFTYFYCLLQILRHFSPHLNQNHQEKVTIFSGHDTVIAPVLSGLGVYRGRLCRWPQYASRIIFELWEFNSNTKGSISSQKLSKAATGYLSKHPEKDSQTTGILNEADRKALLGEKYFVRVLFNGEDVTERIPTCDKERRSLAKYFSGGINGQQDIESSSEWLHLMFADKRFSLCSLSSFTKQIQNMIAPHSTISEACDWK